MKITNKTIRALIQESIAGLLESRQLKQQFYNKIRAKYPDIDKAFFVHWIRSDFDQWEELDKRLGYILGGSQREISSNLVDPAGKTVAPHYGDWGAIGIVFQGIPTFGSMGDVGSWGSETPSGMRVYPGNVQIDQQMRGPYTGELMDYYAEAEIEDPKDTRVDYSVKTNLERKFPLDRPNNVALDLSIPTPFLTHQPGYAYEGGEFLVIPKKLHAVVYLPYYDYLEDQIDTMAGINHFRDNYSSIPFITGREQTGELYRRLYQKVS